GGSRSKGGENAHVAGLNRGFCAIGSGWVALAPGAGSARKGDERTAISARVGPAGSVASVFDRRATKLLKSRVSTEGFPSGQREQTVNLPALPSKVRILPPPPQEQ